MRRLMLRCVLGRGYCESSIDSFSGRLLNNLKGSWLDLMKWHLKLGLLMFACHRCGTDLKQPAVTIHCTKSKVSSEEPKPKVIPLSLYHVLS